MKNTSFKRLWTKTSLKRIRTAFANSHISFSYGFLCLGSREFKSIWNSHKNEIRNISKDFLGEKDWERNNSFEKSFKCDTLFYPGRGGSEGRKELRLEFLDHEIKRLSEKR